MATLNGTFDPEQADWALGYLEREWASVPRYLAEFDAWPEEDQLSFIHEWDIRTSWLHEAREWQRGGKLSVDQARRLTGVESLVARYHNPMELLRDGPTPIEVR